MTFSLIVGTFSLLGIAHLWISLLPKASSRKSSTLQMKFMPVIWCPPKCSKPLGLLLWPSKCHKALLKNGPTRISSKPPTCPSLVSRKRSSQLSMLNPRSSADLPMREWLPTPSKNLLKKLSELLISESMISPIAEIIEIYYTIPIAIQV